MLKYISIGAKSGLYAGRNTIVYPSFNNIDIDVELLLYAQLSSKRITLLYSK